VRSNVWIALSLSFALYGAYVLQGLRQIPANPPHKGAITRLGKRLKNEIADEGWVFLPFYPFYYGVITVNVTKKNLDLEPEEIRTPDLAELSVPVSVTYTPTNLISYLDAGEEMGVNNIVSDVIEEALREWAINDDREPKSWVNALKQRGDAIPILINAVLGRDHDTPIDSEEVAKTRAGNGDMECLALGFKLNRLNIGEIKPLGALASAAEQDAKEERERLAETRELEHVRDRIKDLVAMGFSREQALEIVQTERNKVAKSINESKFTIPSETRESLERVASGLVNALTSGKGKSDE